MNSTGGKSKSSLREHVRHEPSGALVQRKLLSSLKSVKQLGPNSMDVVSSFDSSSYRRLSCRFPSFRYPFCWRLIRF